MVAIKTHRPVFLQQGEIAVPEPITAASHGGFMIVANYGCASIPIRFFWQGKRAGHQVQELDGEENAAWGWAGEANMGSDYVGRPAKLNNRSDAGAITPLAYRGMPQAWGSLPFLSPRWGRLSS
jgi:hypothetical protein